MSGNHTPCRGFIALMSAVIISSVLMLIVISGSLGGFFARSNVLDAELKSRSRAVADACLDQAMLLIANTPGYTGTDTQVFNGLDTCVLIVSGGVPTKSIVVEGKSTPSVTNLTATYDTVTNSLTSWQEVP